MNAGASKTSRELREETKRLIVFAVVVLIVCLLLRYFGLTHGPVIVGGQGSRLT